MPSCLTARAVRLVDFDFLLIIAIECQFSIMNQLVISTFKKQIPEKRKYYPLKKSKTCMEEIADQFVDFLSISCEEIHGEPQHFWQNRTFRSAICQPNFIFLLFLH